MRRYVREAKLRLGVRSRQVFIPSDPQSGVEAEVDWGRCTAILGGSKLRHFFCAVLCHELGHHYTFQYDSKNKLIPNKTTNENLADLHGSRILLAIAKDLKELIGSMKD